MAGKKDRKDQRGFASMDAEKQRAIASMGGKAAHQKGTAHEFTPEEAREAGRKGGEAVSRNRDHMAEIGREGGQNSRSSRGDADRGSESGGDAVEDRQRHESRVG